MFLFSLFACLLAQGGTKILKPISLFMFEEGHEISNANLYIIQVSIEESSEFKLT